MNTRHEILHPLIVLGLFVFAPASVAVPSFPGAQGGGAGSVGGRGGAVIEVTNLNDSGAGSLRACVTASGPRTCVFRVGGTIQVLSDLYITNPYLTVAGQTAPGGGILLSGKNMADWTMIGIATHDVVWRYMRIRKGYHPAAAGQNVNLGSALLVGGGGYNIVIDHNSISWNQDEGIGLAGGGAVLLNNITISSNLVAEGLSNHSTGYIVSGGAGMTNIDFHRNLTMNESHRNPAINPKSVRYVNNITYNTKLFDVQVGWPNLVTNGDFIGNLWKKGPMHNNAHHEIAVYGVTSVYMSLNKGYNQSNPNGDQWFMVRESTGQNGPESGPVPTSWRRTTPLGNTTYPITAEPVAGLEASVLPIVGASRRLDCNGNWVAARDSVDSRLVNQYQTNTGISSLVANESQVGGFPVIAGGTPCTDTDHDGMPDGWEAARALNANNAADRNTIGGSGYTNLEVYLAGTGSGTTQSSPPPPPPSPPPTTSLPDVVVTSLSYANRIFTSTVKNQGTVATPAGIGIGVGYFVDGVFETWGAVANPPLAAGQSAPVGTNGASYTIPTGTHTIKAYVDDVNRFAESNETNNQLSKQITVP